MRLRNIIQQLLFLLAMSFASCTSDLDLRGEAQGTLRLSLPNVSSETRAVPAALGVPAAEDFNVNVTATTGRTFYNGAYTATELTIPIGDYIIVATHGDNPLIGLDAPYYVGTATATVREDETTTVDVPVSIGNALVSAHFGRDETEQARFARFYSACAVRVSLGNNSASITQNAPDKSVYVRAGSTVSLAFVGTLASGGRQVSMPIALPDGMSYTLDAADHLDITLSLEASEDGAVINVHKAEVTKVTIEEAIPYAWLPAPTVTPTHRYNDAGELIGTDLSVTRSFPDLTWTTQIHQGSAAGPVVRTLTGKGTLNQSYAQDASWPFLPSGTYVATFSYVSQQGQTFDFSKTRTFTVPQPNLTLTVDGYTAHTRYEQGDVSGANACERCTFYAPSAKWSVANSLLTNANYTRTYARTFNNQTITETAGVNNPEWSDVTEVPVSGTPYNFSVTATFCGQATVASKNVRITGLPYSLNLKSHSEWSSSGSVDWFDNDVRLGRLSTGGQSITTNSSVNIPQNTRFCADYDVNVHSATVGTTFSITAGNQEMLSIREDGGLFNNKDNLHKGTTNTITANSNITSLTCHNSYGAGQTCSHIYALTFKYAQ